MPPSSLRGLKGRSNLTVELLRRLMTPRNDSSEIASSFALRVAEGWVAVLWTPRNDRNKVGDFAYKKPNR